jgi:hypothetical protein
MFNRGFYVAKSEKCRSKHFLFQPYKSDQHCCVTPFYGEIFCRLFSIFLNTIFLFLVVSFPEGPVGCFSCVILPPFQEPEKRDLRIYSKLIEAETD